MALSRMAHGEAFLETGFEGSSGLPTGWTVTSISGNASWNIQNGGANGNPTSAHNGSNNATLFAPNTNDNKTQLISPTFDTTGFINISLSFWHTQAEWSPNQDDLKVFFSSDGGSVWTELAHYTGNVPAWTLRTLAIPVASANSRIAFEGNARYGYGVCLDEIEVSGIPDTFSVVSVSATDSDASEAGPDVGTWTITRTGNTSGALSVNYSLGGTAVADSDYTLDSSAPINFAAGETSKVVILTPIDDVLGECDEVARLTLLDGTGYAIDSTSGDISISDDDRYDRNILVIGSTRSFSDSGESGVVQEKPFNPSSIATHLEGILAQDPLLNESVDVVFEDIFKTKSLAVNYDPTEYNFSSHCYSLAQHYMWPEGKAERLANLRGEAGTEWDTIVLCADPYILANFPGMYAEGVKLIQNEVARSTNPVQIVLLAQWPENSSSFSADDFNEVVYRVGDSAGLTVVPAGKAWESYSSQDTSAAHPTPKGGYLAAASIYSKLYDRSAKTSGYNFPSGGDAIADHAHSVVRANTGVAQYTGAYTSINPFQMKYVTKRVVSFRETGSSTEDRIRAALNRLDDVQRITLSTSGYTGGSGTRWDFNYGRGNDWWEDSKDYEVDPGKYDRSYGFPMHHYPSSAPTTMAYGIDKHYFNGTGYEDGTDLGIAYNMIRPGTRELSLPEDVRAIPIRLMWLKMREISPGLNPLGDNTHMAAYLNDATAAFMYTLLSGRCAMVEEPASEGSTEWLQWLGHKIGYETAWQMSHLATRAPGFRVLPSSTSATTVSPTSTETMTVQFANPPQEDVTVTVSVSSPTAAIVGPETLVFTPSNYNTPQEVTVAGVPGATVSEPFEVLFSTSSTDGVYDGISDAWAYTCNRSSTSSVSQVDHGTTQVITPQFTPVDINLDVAGADAGNTIFAGPSHGSIAWTGTEDIQYTPDGDYHGSDQIVYAVTLDGTQSIGTIDISVQMPGGDLPDETAPTISILSPADDASSVTLGANLVVTFDEPVQAGTGNIVLKTSSDDSTVEIFDVSTDILFKGPEMIINPTCELVSTTGYYVIMDNGAVVDDSGNTFAGLSGPTTWNFTTWVGGIAVTQTGTPTVVDSGATSATIADWSLNGGNAVVLFFAGETGKDLSATYGGEEMTVIEDSTGGRWVGAIAYIIDPIASTGDIAFSWVNDGAKSETIHTPMSLSNVGAAVASSSRDVGSELSFNYATVVDEGLVVGAAANNRYSGGASAAPAFFGNLDTALYQNNVSGNCAVTLVYGDGITAGSYTDSLGGDPEAESATIVVFEPALNDTPGNTYASYIDAYPGVGSLTDLADDPDGDGIANGLEVWFGTHPGASSQSLSGLATDGTTLTFTHPRSANPPTDLSIFYQWSKNLVDWYECDGVDGPASGQTVNATWATVGTTTTATATASEAMERLFIRAGIQQN